MSFAVEPLTRFLGIAPSGLGILICSSTTPRIVLRFSPSSMLASKALSRSGPTTPFVSARASVWHEPHLATNAFLPAITLTLSRPLTSPQPDAASAPTEQPGHDRAARSAARTARGPAGAAVLAGRRGSSSEGGTLSERADAESLRRQALQDPPCRALRDGGAGRLTVSADPPGVPPPPRARLRRPAPTTSGCAPPRRARRASPRAAPAAPAAHAITRSAIASTALVVDGEAQPCRGRRRQLGGERLGDLGQPGVARDDRNRPARRGLRRDHPERLGERARGDQRAACRQQLRQLLVLQAARQHDALAERLGGGQIALAALALESVEERQQVAKRRRGRPSRPAAFHGDLAGAAEVPGGERAAPAPPAPRGRRRTRRPRGAPPARAPARAASSRPAGRRPCSRSACRRRPRAARAAGSRRASAAAASRRIAVEGAAGRARPAAQPPARPASSLTPAAAAAGSRGAKRATSTPGGPSRVRSGSCGSSIAAHRLAAV